MRKSSTGVVMVTVLLILAAVLALGAGTMFLTQMNLGLSSNVKTSAESQFNADSGLQASILALESAYNASVSPFTGVGTLPATGYLTAKNQPSVRGPDLSGDYQVVSYQRSATNDQEGRIVVRGLGPNQSEYVSEAVIKMVPGTPTFPPSFTYGLSTEGKIYVKGSSTYISAGIHGNKGYSLKSNLSNSFFVCTARADDGTCSAMSPVPLSDAPVSASPGATLCAPSALCSNGGPRTMTDPVDIASSTSYYKRLVQLATSQPPSIGDSGGSPTTFTVGTYGNVQVGCTVTFQAGDKNALVQELTKPTTQGETVCYTGSDSISLDAGSLQLTNVSLVSGGNITFTGTTKTPMVVKNASVVSTSGTVSANNVAVTNGRIFSYGDIVFNGNKTSFKGDSTLATNGNVTIDGGAPATSLSSGSPGVGLGVIASGNVTVNGSSDWFIAALAGGTFTQNGTSTIYGKISSVGTLTLNGGVDIDSGLPIDNQDLKQPGPYHAEILSMR